MRPGNGGILLDLCFNFQKKSALILIVYEWDSKPRYKRNDYNSAVYPPSFCHGFAYFIPSINQISSQRSTVVVVG